MRQPSEEQKSTYLKALHALADDEARCNRELRPLQDAALDALRAMQKDCDVDPSVGYNRAGQCWELPQAPQLAAPE